MTTQSREQALAALKYWEDQGDTEKANRVRAALGASAPPTKGETAIAGASQALTLGYGDEIAGATLATAGHLFDRPYNFGADVSSERQSMGDAYTMHRDSARDINRQNQTANPWTYGLSEFAAGAAIPGGGAVKGAQALNRARQSVKPLGALAVTGGATAGIAGLGYSEAETPGGMALDTGIATGLGAALTPALATAGNFAGRGIANLAGGLKRRLASSPQEQAQLRLAQALEAEDLGTVEQVRSKLAALGPQGRLADVGPVLQQQGVAASKVPGPGRTFANDVVDARQAGQEGRLAQAARETVDPKWTDYGDYLSTIERELSEQAGEAYKVAYQRGVTPTPELGQLSRDNDYFKKSLERAMASIKNDVESYPGTAGLQTDGTVSTQLLDYAMRELRDMASKAYKSGANNEGRMIKNVEKRIRDIVFKQNPDLKTAMSIFRGGKELEGAAERGRELLFKRVRPDELKREMGDWSQSERDSFRVGLMQGIFDKLEDATSNQNSAGRLVNSSRAQKVLKQAFGDNQSFDDFMKVVDAENAMQLTRNKVTGGSPTMELTEAASTAPQLFSRGLVGGIQDLLLRLGAEKPDLKKLSAEDYEAMSKYLFGEIDDETIQQLLTPTLRSRMRSSGALSPEAGMLGVGGTQSAISNYGSFGQ